MDKDFISIVSEEINNTDNINYKIYLEKLINFYKEPSKYGSEICYYIETNDYKNIILHFNSKYARAKMLNVVTNYSISRVESEIKATDILLKKDYSDRMFKHKIEFQEKLEKLTKMTEKEREELKNKKLSEIREEHWKFSYLITKKVMEELGISEKAELNKDDEIIEEIQNGDLRKATDLILNYIKEAKEEILKEIRDNKK